MEAQRIRQAAEILADSSTEADRYERLIANAQEARDLLEMALNMMARKTWTKRGRRLLARIDGTS